MKTELTQFLFDILGWWIKHNIEEEIGEEIDEKFFVEHYLESAKRWNMFVNVEHAYSFYQEAIEEIKADWWGRNSRPCMEVAKEAYEDLDDDGRLEFLEWVKQKSES